MLLLFVENLKTLKIKTKKDEINFKINNNLNII